MNLDWIDRELARCGMPRRILAEYIPGLTETKVSLVMSGQRKLTSIEADAIRRFFGYRLPDDLHEGPLDVILDQLSELNDGQLRLVNLFIDALLIEDAAQKKER